MGWALWMMAWVSAWAHGLDQDRIALEVEGDRVLMVVTPPASLFPTVDEDGDGVLAAEEIRKRRDVIDAVVDGGLALTDARGRHGEVYFSDVVVPDAARGHGHTHGPPHIRVIRRLRFPDEVQGVELDVSSFPPVAGAWTAHVRMDGRTRSYRVEAPRARVVVARPEPSGDRPLQAVPTTPRASDRSQVRGVRLAALVVWLVALGLAGGMLVPGALRRRRSPVEG